MLRQMNRKPTALDHWLAILAIVLGGGAVVQIVSESIVLPRGTPVIFSGQQAIVLNEARGGGQLRIRIYREKRRDDCPVETRAILINDMTKAVLALDNQLSVGGPAGTEYVDVSYPMPQTLPPGGYILRDSLTYRCPERSFVIQQPDIHFEVKP